MTLNIKTKTKVETNHDDDDDQAVMQNDDKRHYCGFDVGGERDDVRIGGATTRQKRTVSCERAYDKDEWRTGDPLLHCRCRFP